MPEIYEQYTSELNEQYGYLATWLPNVRLRLGDVGLLKRDRFEFITSLTNLGISFSTRDGGEEANYQYVSANGANIDINADGEAAGVGSALVKSSAKASITFKRANAVVFVAKGCKTTFIDQQDVLGKKILERFQTGDWQKDYVIITEVVSAESGTVFVSSSADGKVELSAESKLGPSGLSLADASAGLQVARSSGVATQIVASKNLTPLFRASGLRHRLFGGTSFGTRSESVDAQPKEPELLFSDVDYTDL